MRGRAGVGAFLRFEFPTPTLPGGKGEVFLGYTHLWTGVSGGRRDCSYAASRQRNLTMNVNIVVIATSKPDERHADTESLSAIS